MKTNASIHALLRVALVLGAVSLTGCPDDPAEDGGTTGDTTGTDTTTVNPPDSTSSSDGSDLVPDSSTSSSDGADSTTTGGEDAFEFPTDPYDAYTQIDRHGAVEAGTAGILASAGLGFNGEDLSVRDSYNASNPQEDADEVWLPEIADSIAFFHDNLDDDLVLLKLDPATIAQTVDQAGPVIIPDTIKYDPSAPTSYPNGRNLEDQVVDITLAAVLLDLGTHDIRTFANIPLNPPENDVPFQTEFPYLAPPHLP